MTRTAILQIGTEKTGSTTLQTFLAANRVRLAERGYRYPRFCGEFNHTGLAAYAMDADREEPLRHPFGGHGPETVRGMRESLHAKAELELSDGMNAILCNEHCHSRLVSRTEVERLRDFLGGFFDEIRISVYLRRQDQMALSLYSTVLKSGGTPETLLPRPSADDPYYNYDRFLSLWEEVFGPENVKVRLFERAALTGGSIVQDFLTAWSLGSATDYVAVADQNGSIAAEAQDFLRAINPHLSLPGKAPDDRLRGPVITALERLFPGRGPRPARDCARAFYDVFRASNAAVAERHFPGRNTLFDENFDVYPEHADHGPSGPDDFARVAAALLIDRSREIARLEAEIAIREAGLHWRDDQAEAALAKLQGAIAGGPDHPGLHRSLGEYLLRLDRIGDALAAARTACALSPDNWEFRHFLGIVLAAAGEPDEAAEAQRQALHLNPGHPGAETALERALAACTPDRRKTA